MRDRIIRPITLREANKFVRSYHSYLTHARGCLFCVAAEYNREIVAVAIVGRPSSRQLDDGVTAEITRLCTHNAPRNSASALIRRCTKAAFSIGFHRMISFVDASRSGTAFTAAAFKRVSAVKRKQWHGRNFCVPANASESSVKFEVTTAAYDRGDVSAKRAQCDSLQIA